MTKLVSRAFTHSDTVNTGLYSAQEGGTSCTSCLGHTAVEMLDPETVCTHAGPGRAFITDVTHLRHLFDKYTEDRPSIILADLLTSFVRMDMHACRVNLAIMKKTTNVKLGHTALTNQTLAPHRAMLATTDKIRHRSVALLVISVCVCLDSRNIY